jgi:hypothetical protein
MGMNGGVFQPSICSIAGLLEESRGYDYQWILGN